MKREFKCVTCGVIVTGRKLPDGRVKASNGPPDPTQKEPDPGVCFSCVELLAQ